MNVPYENNGKMNNNYANPSTPYDNNRTKAQATYVKNPQQMPYDNKVKMPIPTSSVPYNQMGSSTYTV